MRQDRTFHFLFVASVLVVMACFMVCAPKAFAQSKVPCVSKDPKGNWKVDEDTECAQYTTEEFRTRVVDPLLKLDYYKNKYEPAMEALKREHERLNEAWKRDMANWQQQTSVYANLAKLNQEEAKTWREAFYDLKKQKVPARSWTVDPRLWFAVGVVVTVGVIVGAAYLVDTVRSSVSK